MSFSFDLYSATVTDSHLPCHAMPMPCSDHAVLLKGTTQHGRRETAVLCCALEKNGMVGAWHGHGMASVNQSRSHCINQMRKTHSKLLTARHGRGKAWERHGHCMLCVNRPLRTPVNRQLVIKISSRMIKSNFRKSKAGVHKPTASGLLHD